MSIVAGIVIAAIAWLLIYGASYDVRRQVEEYFWRRDERRRMRRLCEDQKAFYLLALQRTEIRELEEIAPRR